MHEFLYKNNQLYCENILAEKLAKTYGSPLYVYSYATLADHFIKLRNAFTALNPLICYSVKANSNLAILKALVNLGAGLDIVSGGELTRALKVGCSAKKIVYASVGKTDSEIARAISKGILFFNVESLPELININRIAQSLNKVTQVAIRINPDVEAKTHKFITTGKITNKFGIDLDSAYKILLMRGKFRYVRICGLHIHIGSQITQSEPFVAAIKKVSNFINKIKIKGVCLDYLNIGGGLGIIYDNENPQSAQIYANQITPLLKKTGLKIIMEPGRFIVGNAGILITKVLYIKKTPKKKFIIVDAGMNDLIRPALYGAYHKVIPLVKIAQTEKADVVGPICESGDFLAKARMIAKVKVGDYLAVMSAGAYGFSMSSNYNSRLRAAEVMVANNKVFVIRKREEAQDLMRNEIIPSSFTKC
ncbi:MAG: diaminopimelate decarboxylase [Candidatus Omnitrophica bacterium]|nr:diaminopimelate decarboxylase [Candidatus Omnitrophota bacterium]